MLSRYCAREWCLVWQANGTQAPPHLHADEEAGGHLRARRAGVEQRRAGVREPALAEQLVRLDGGLEVLVVDAHLLGAHMTSTAATPDPSSGAAAEGEP